MINNNTTTLRYDLGGGATEHILVIKGRPFAVLESQNIPTPGSTYLDYHLVKELGLKVGNMMYERMTYCGQKMRKVGTVSVTAQTLHGGRVLGSIALKATVVLGLAQFIDADAVAGIKLLHSLSANSPPSQVLPSPRASPPPGRPSPRSRGSPTTPPAPPSSSPPSPAPSTPQHVRACRFPSPPRTLSPLSARSSSPPGYPLPVYTPVYESLHQQSVTLSPRSTNLSAFKQTFRQADERVEPRHELMYLQQVVDPGGVIDDEVDMFYFSDYSATYETGHGRTKCNPGLCVKPGHPPEAVPSNCGYHQDWIMPNGFKECGEGCRGAFCNCISEYPINCFADYYDFDEGGKVYMMKE